MKYSIKSLVAIAAFGAFAFAAHAQPAFKLLVVDIAKLYDGHYKTIEQNAKMKTDQDKATEEAEKLSKEVNALIASYKEFAEKNAIDMTEGRPHSNHPAMSAEAKSKAEAEAVTKIESIQRKQQEGQQFVQNTGQILNQRFQNFKNLMLEEIGKVAADIAKRKGATLLLDKSGPSAYGVPNVIYTDPGYDITDDVLKEINKDRPAVTPTPPAAAAPATATPASPAAAPASSSTITVPGMPKK